MSSFIEWPTIYGSVYFLPGIIVVVLLLLLLLLMSSRRRAKAERARLAPEPALAFEGPAPEDEEQPEPAPETTAYPGYTPGVMTQPVATTMQQGGVVTQHVGLYTPVTQPSTILPQPAVAPSLTLVAPPAPAAAPAMMADPDAMAAPVMEESVTMAPLATDEVLDDDISEPDSMFEPAKSSRRAKSKAARSTAPLSVVTTVNTPSGTDPLNAAIQEILNGWGELAPEDMKRLELFRPDRLNAALLAVQLPKSKSNDAKVRLTQMRQYGLGLERRAQATQEAEAAATIPAESTHTGGTLAAVAGQMAVEESPIVQRSTIFTGYASPAAPVNAAPVNAAPAAAETVAATLTPAPEQEAPTQAARNFYDAEPEITHPASADVPDSLWAAPRPLWEPDPEPAFEELPAPAFDEIEMEPAATNGVPLDTSALSAALNVPMGMPVHETPTYSKALFDDELLWDDEASAISRLSLKVETAEQLMALPPTERVDMTAFLPPTELAATFRATHDLELKKAVIDTLEHIGTPASLNALGNCFEDADPDIQVYALAAADRLLGVAS